MRYGEGVIMNRKGLLSLRYEDIPSEGIQVQLLVYGHLKCLFAIENIRHDTIKGWYLLVQQI